MSQLLSERDVRTVLLIGCYRYLTRRQLEEFLLTDTPTTPLSRQVITKRILQRLRSRGLLMAQKRLVGGPGGGSSLVGYHLSPMGLGLAASLDPDMPATRPVRGTFLLQHSLMTADVALAFRRAAAANAGHELLEWECDWQAVRRLGSELVIPDARFVYATKDTEVEALVEVDLGSEGTRFFGRKIGRYLDLFRSGGWRSHLPAWPLVLVVTASPQRTLTLKRATEAIIAAQADRARIERQTEFVFSDVPRLLRDGPTARIWYVAGSRSETDLFSRVARNEQAVD